MFGTFLFRGFGHFGIFSGLLNFCIGFWFLLAHNHEIKSSTLISKAFASFLSVSRVGFSFLPASIFMTVLFETSARRASFSCVSPFCSRSFRKVLDMFDIAYTKVVEFKYHQYFNSSTIMLPKMGAKIKCARTGGWGKHIFLSENPQRLAPANGRIGRGGGKTYPPPPPPFFSLLPRLLFLPLPRQT